MLSSLCLRKLDIWMFIKFLIGKSILWNTRKMLDEKIVFRSFRFCVVMSRWYRFLGNRGNCQIQFILFACYWTGSLLFSLEFFAVFKMFFWCSCLLEWRLLHGDLSFWDNGIKSSGFVSEFIFRFFKRMRISICREWIVVWCVFSCLICFWYS